MAAKQSPCIEALDLVVTVKNFFFVFPIVSILELSVAIETMF